MELTIDPNTVWTVEDAILLLKTGRVTKLVLVQGDNHDWEKSWVVWHILRWLANQAKEGNRNLPTNYRFVTDETLPKCLNGRWAYEMALDCLREEYPRWITTN